MRHSWLGAVLLAALLAVPGCIIWTDPDDDDYERVVYTNFTDWDVDCWIDDEYVGTVDAHDDLVVRDRHWDGWHEFYSESYNGITTWGPDDFHLDDGDTLYIDLVDYAWNTRIEPAAPISAAK